MDMAGSAARAPVKRIETCACCASASSRGRRHHGAPGAPRRLRRDRQLLHPTVYEKGRRGRAHDADAGRPRGLRQRHGALLPAPRRPGRHLRRLRPGHRRRQPGQRAGARCRSSSAGTRRPARRVTARGRWDAPRAPTRSTLEQHASRRPGRREAAVRDPGGDGPGLATATAADRAAPGRRERRQGRARAVLVLEEASAPSPFVDVDREPVPSLLRHFSAPVRLFDGLSTTELLVLLAHDSDPFNRWEAGQRLALRRLTAAAKDGHAPRPDAAFVEAMRACCATRRWTRPSRRWC